MSLCLSIVISSRIRYINTHSFQPLLNYSSIVIEFVFQMDFISSEMNRKWIVSVTIQVTTVYIECTLWLTWSAYLDSFQWKYVTSPPYWLGIDHSRNFSNAKTDGNIWIYRSTLINLGIYCITSKWKSKQYQKLPQGRRLMHDVWSYINVPHKLLCRSRVSSALKF